ncbi:MAG: hypothetical protein QGF87_03715 [Woeseiaceae bacterium]|nr:hypothetical protein [Woeseiaceae bacterium]
MRTITTFLTAALSTLLAGVVVAQDFSHFEYRNIGPSRGGRVTAVAGTVAEPATFYLGASGGGVWKTEDYGTTWQVVSDGYFETPSIGDIAVAQNDPNIVYVGTGSDGLRSNVIAGKGMYKSIDGGDTWNHIGLRETGQIGAVEIDPTDHNIVWVAAIGQAFNANEERGVFKTVDGGRSWERVLYHSDTVGFSDVELLPSNPNIVFATAWKAERKPWTIISGGEQDEGGLYKSVDAGVTWEKITEGLPAGLIGKIDLAVSPSDTNIVYALVEAPGEEGGLFKSVDQGNTFKQVSSDSTIRTRPFYYANIEVDPRNPDVVYSMATLNKKSTDGGKTWERLRVPHEDNHDMWINPNNPDLFIQGNDGGANVTHNGGKTWSTQFNQPTAELYTVEVDDQYPYWLYAGQQDNSTTIASPSMPPFRAQDPAAWLVDSGGCETGPAIPKPGNHNIVYAECKGRFFVFDKRIGTEKEYAIGAGNIYGHNPRDLEYRFQRVAPLSVSPHDPDKVYMGSQYVHVTTDGGETWATISPDLTAFEDETQVISGSPITRDITGEEYYSTLYSLRESPVQEGVIWAGSNDGPVHVTQDGGETWENVTPRGLPQGGRVDSVEPSPHNAAKAYITVMRYQFGDWRPYIYKTEDFGRRWEQIVDGIPDDFPVRVVREDPVRNGLLFAGTEWGMFVSLDDGENWHRFQQNLGVTPVTDLKVIRGDLAISTMGRSFWVLDNIATLRDPAFDTQGDDVMMFTPKDTIRYRNIHRDRSANGVPDYPPPAAIIDYYLPEGIETPIRLEILDASGALVNAYESEPGEGDTDIEIIEDMQLSQSRIVVNENLSAEAGTNRFRWDMTHFGAWDEDEDDRYTGGPLVRPGNYTIRLTAGGTTVSQVLTIVVDPRVTAQGTSLEDIDEQVAMQLVLTDLVSGVRQFQQTVENEQADLEKRSDDLTPDEAERLLLVTDVLNQVKDAEIIYPRPMLARQISFLLNMISGADQAPGVEAADRLTELSATFADLKARYAGNN